MSTKSKPSSLTNTYQVSKVGNVRLLDGPLGNNVFKNNLCQIELFGARGKDMNSREFGWVPGHWLLCLFNETRIDQRTLKCKWQYCLLNPTPLCKNIAVYDNESKCGGGHQMKSR